MTKKKDLTAEKLQKAKADNAVVYKTMLALLLLCGALMGLRALRSYYGTIGGFDVLYPLSIWIGAIGWGVFVLCGLVLILVKRPIVRAVLPWIMAVAALAGATGVSMRMSWTEGFPTLYFLAGAMLLQYIIFLLYRWEFFLFSLSTAASGFLFYHLSTSFSWSLLSVLVLALTIAVLGGTALLAHAASRNQGLLVFGRKRIQLFPAKSNPILIYLVDVLWLVCIAASLFLGGLFAYYCMFAAIAVEFIAAVYYTFQLN